METVETAKKNYPVIITQHARQRYVERVISPKKYDHLHSCHMKGQCDKCVTLIHDLKTHIQLGQKYMDREICRRTIAAIASKKVVTDKMFLEAADRQFGTERNLRYYVGQEGFVYVTTWPEGSPPVLLTILTSDLMEGVMFMAYDREEIQSVFSSWKFRRRMVTNTPVPKLEKK